MESDSLKLISLLIRRSWLIVLAAVLTGGLAYYSSSNQEPSYTAVALISIGDPTSIADPSEALIATGELLAQQYSVIIETQQTMSAIIDELNLDELEPAISPDKLRRMVSTTTVSDTSFLRINVGSTDPQLAADIANAIASYLEVNNLSDVEEAEREFLEDIEQQIEDIRAQSDETQARIIEIDAEVDALNQQLVLLTAMPTVTPTATATETSTPTATATNTPDPEATEDAEATAEPEATEEIAVIIDTPENTGDDTNNTGVLLPPSSTNIQTRIDELRAERINLVGQRSLDLSSLASLRSTLNEYSTRINDIEILDLARVPVASGGINPIIVAVAGAITGGILAVAVIMMFEFLDTTVRNSDEALEVLGVPILGVVPKSRKIRTTFANYDPPKSTGATIASESYRTIQTNLFLSSSAKQNKSNVYLFVSPNEQEGRTITASNVAVMAAEAGMKVLLIDADLRDPTLHKVFDAENKRGLATLMALAAGQMNLDPSETESGNKLVGILKNHIQDTPIPNLKLITSGLSQVEVSAKILGFDSLSKYLDYVQKMIKFDAVLIDTPPALGTADSYILAATTNANIIMLIEAGKTTRNATIRVRDQLLHIGGNISGVIINKA